MIFVPLPFVVALVLIILLVRMLRQGEADQSAGRLFLLLLAANALQSVVIGLNWGYGFRAVLPLQAVLAALIAALSWVSFSSLATERADTGVMRYWPHLLPALLIVLFLAFWRDAIGPALMLIFLAYGGALLWLALRGPDALAASRVDGVVRSHRALMITTFATLASPVADLFITFDLQWTGGVNSAAIIAASNVVTLLVLGAAAAVAGDSAPAADDESDADEAASPPAATSGDAAVAAALGELMRTRGLYKDVELNLGRIAKRLGVPTRQVSSAVNRVHGVSVSQYVNTLRVEEACRLLETTDEPVTRVMFDAGFLSKSNFNREFLRVTGQGPKAWRESRRPARMLPDEAASFPGQASPSNSLSAMRL